MKKFLALFLSIILAIPSAFFFTSSKTAEAASNVGAYAHTVTLKAWNTGQRAINVADGMDHAVIDVEIAAVDGVAISPITYAAGVICNDARCAAPQDSRNGTVSGPRGGYMDFALEADGTVQIPGGDDASFWGDPHVRANWSEYAQTAKPGFLAYSWQRFYAKYAPTPIPQITAVTDTGAKWVLWEARADNGSVNNPTKYWNAEEAYWNMVGNQATYEAWSSPTQMSFSNNITAEDYKIVWETHSIYIGSTCVYYKANYWWGESSTSTNNITYKAQAPVITQEKYCPYNLNYNRLSQAGDSVGPLDSSFTNGEAIAATVNNLHNVTDGQNMSTLNLNNDYNFKVVFNTKTFGLPEKYNWYNDPPELSHGTWEDTVYSGPYANGHIAAGDGNYRYGTTLYAALQENNDSATLVYNGKEYTSDSPLQVSNKNGDWRGGDFSVRFLITGLFNTGNNIKNSKYPDWWTVKYSQCRFYEYGTRYKGKVTVDGVYKPQLVNCGSVESWTPHTPFGWGNNESLQYSSDGTSTRGIYVSSDVRNFEQPVVYGKWEVKTIAGDLG